MTIISEFGPHGARDLPNVRVDSYNLELRSAGGFVGDRANKRALADIIEGWRERLRRLGQDPLGDTSASALSKRKLDEMLAAGDPDQAGLVHAAIEEFSNGLAAVIRRFRDDENWTAVERIAIGGGLRASRVGELVIGRTALILKSEGFGLDLAPIRHSPDEAGLIGAVQLAPPALFDKYRSLAAVDIGGTKMRAGIILANRDTAADLSNARVWDSRLWRHADGGAADRDAAIAKLAAAISELADRATAAGLDLAPFIGVGCPGVIEPDGVIDRGGQNLPGGNWDRKQFDLPRAIRRRIPTIGGKPSIVLLHNDAVVQGLSQFPFMRDVEHWGILTIGTGLGNACFSNKDRA